MPAKSRRRNVSWKTSGAINALHRMATVPNGATIDAGANPSRIHQQQFSGDRGMQSKHRLRGEGLPAEDGGGGFGEIHATKLPVSPITIRTSPVHQSLLFKYRASFCSSSSSSSLGCGSPYVADEVSVAVLWRRGV